MKNKTLFLFTIILMTFSQIYATTFYVSVNGSDSTGNGTANNPWASLSYACSQVATSGDTIHINPGNYTDNNQCILAIGVNIEGAGSDVVKITSNVSTDNYWYLIASSFPVTDGNHNISGFTLDGDNRTLTHGMQFKGRNNVQIHKMIIQNINRFGLQIYAVDGVTKTTPPSTYISGIEVNNNTIQHCGRLENGESPNDWSTSCLSIGGLDYASIHNNKIIEEKGGGIIFWEKGWFKGLKLYNNNINVTGTSPLWGSQIAIELWNLFDDCQIYNNTSNNWFSLVKGNKGNGSYSVIVYDNRIVFDSPNNPKEGVELGLGLYDAEMRNNYIENGKFGVVIWGAAPNTNEAWNVSNIQIHHNVFYNHHNDYTFGIFINPSPNETYTNTQIYNNVFDGVDEGIQIAIQANGLVKDTSIKNNIFMNVPNALVTKGGSQIQNTEIAYNFYTGDILLENTPTSNLTASNNMQTSPNINNSGNRPAPFYEANGINSNIVDAGIAVGLAYLGSAPDIGAYENGAVLSVSDVSDSPLKVYPNPTTGIVNVPSQFSNATYNVYTVTGFLVDSGEIMTSFIDFSKQNNGFFILQIQDKETGKMYINKVLKK